MATPDGSVITNRVDGTTDRDLNRKVTDNILNSPTMATRSLSMGKEFNGKTKEFTVKISDTDQGEWFDGVPTLNTAATDTTATLSFSQANYSHPIVIPMDDAIENAGSGQVIPLIAFKTDEAKKTAIRDLGLAYYGIGAGDMPTGIGALIDNGTVAGTVGGLSRTTYTGLKATKTATGGTLTLTKMSTMWNAITAGAGGTEQPTIIAVSPATFAIYEGMIPMTITGNVNIGGYSMLPVNGSRIVKEGQMLGAAGFTVLTYKGIAMVADPYCPDGYMYFINENYMDWHGRNVVPSEFKGKLNYVDLGEASTIEGQAMMPSKFHGFFMTDLVFSPNQPAAVKRLYVFGNWMGRNFRRNGVLTGITA